MKRYDSMLKHLQANDTILTVNARLAVHLQERLSDLSPQYVRPAHMITSINQWLNHFWPLHAEGILLNSLQENTLWTQTIQANSNDILINHQTCAALAKQAYDSLIHWQLSLDSIKGSSALETQLFYRWARAFEKACIERQWVCAAKQWSFVLDSIIHNPDLIPARLYLVGFTDPTPLQQHCFDTLGKHIDIVFIHGETHQNTPLTHQSGDPAQENKDMALWAATQIKNGLSCACIVPDLSERRDSILSTFKQVLTPEALLYSEQTQQYFNISQAGRLSNEPVITTALDIYSLFSGYASAQHWLRLFNSSTLIKHPSSAQWFYQLCQVIDRLDQAELSNQSMLSIIQKSKAHDTQSTQCKEAWISALQSIETQRLQKYHHSIEHWIEQHLNLLQDLGWPGGRGIDSETHQAIECFKNLHLSMRSLSLIQKKWSQVNFTAQLTEQIHQCLFQPKGKDAPIQILGILEASVLSFDCVWVSGMSQTQWPPIQKPHPFLPLELQRKHQMPHSSLERESAYANSQFQQLKRLAPTVIFSYPKQINQIDQSATLAISDYPSLSFHPSRPQWEDNGMMLTHYEDDQAPPVSKDELHLGGSQLFKYQAECPFKAFASLRLKAQVSDFSQMGLSAADKGSLVHAIMETLWTELQTQNALFALDDDALHTLVTRHIEQACTTIKKPYQTPFWSRMLEYEKQRLHPIIINWLTLEKERPYFEVIACEKDIETCFSGMTIKVKIDRMDRCHDNQLCIIDYKTGKTQPSDWITTPIAEPQLPLYSVNMPESSQIAFAQIRADNIGFKALGNHDQWEEQLSAQSRQILMDKDIKTWEQLNTYWKQSLNDTAHAFAQGDAAVLPINKKSCQFCRLSALCRIEQ